MLVDVEIAGRVQLEVEPGVEGQQRQEVVDEADPGLDASAAAPVEVERQTQRRLRARADDESVARLGGGSAGAERGEEDVVLTRAPQGDTDPLRELADDEPALLEAGSELLVVAYENEVAVARPAVVACGGERLLHPLPLDERLLDVQPRLAQSSGGDARRRRTDARGRSARLELGRDLGGRDRPADAERGEAERLRQCPQHDQIRALRDQRHTARARVLEVGLVDDDRRVRLRQRNRDDLGRIAQVAGRVVRIADPDHRRAVGSGLNVRAFELGDDPVQPIGGRLDRGGSARGEKGSRTDPDQLVRPRADDDLVGIDAAVGGRRLLQLHIGAVRVVVQPREALGQRHLRHARDGRRVLVEA